MPTMADEERLASSRTNKTFPEKLGMVKRGQPSMKLASLSQSGKGFVHHFQTSISTSGEHAVAPPCGGHPDSFFASTVATPGEFCIMHTIHNSS